MVSTGSANSHSRCLSARRVPHAGAGVPVKSRSHRGLSPSVYDVAGGERVTYNAYGTQTITSATGVVRQKSAVGFDRGFTGYITDNETGLAYARSRLYSPALGRFIGRDPWRKSMHKPHAGDGYPDGTNVYAAYFVPNGLDPLGLEDCWDIHATTIPSGGNYNINAFYVEFKAKCRPHCCTNMKIYQWINDGDGANNLHRDDDPNSNLVGTGPTTPGSPPYSYIDAPGGRTGGDYVLKACAICVRDGGKEETVSCVEFTFNNRTGVIGGVPGNNDPQGNPVGPSTPTTGRPLEPDAPGAFTGCPGVPALPPGVFPPRVPAR
jgi:RHS repeat-associated protein